MASHVIIMPSNIVWTPTASLRPKAVTKGTPPTLAPLFFGNWCRRNKLADLLQSLHICHYPTFAGERECKIHRARKETQVLILNMRKIEPSASFEADEINVPQLLCNVDGKRHHLFRALLGCCRRYSPQRPLRKERSLAYRPASDLLSQQPDLQSLFSPDPAGVDLYFKSQLH